MTAAAGRGTPRAASGGTGRRLARWAAVAALGALGLVLPGPARAAGLSCADAGPCLLVQVVGTRGQGVIATQQFTADDIDNDPNVIAHPQFVQRAPTGHEDTIVPDVALPLTDLIEDVPGLTAQAVSYAEVMDHNGVAHVLDHDQLQAPPGNGFADGLSPSVWAETGASNRGMNSFRPLEADDPNDSNAFDWVTTNGQPSQALVIVLHKTGGILHPSITGPAKVRGATPVRFDVTVPDAPPGLEYQWSVDRVATTTAPRRTSALRHTWPDVSATTTSLITVDVTAGDNSTGHASFVVAVCPQAGNTTRCTTPKPGGGPHHPGGGTHHPSGPPGGPAGGSGHHQGGDPNGSPAPQSPTPHPGDATSGSGPNTAPGTGHTATAVGDPGTRSGHQQGGPRAGRPVSGQLLAASAAFVVPEQRPSATAAAAPRAPTEPRWAWQWTWAGILVVPLLVGLGMAGESLQLRRRLARMSA